MDVPRLVEVIPTFTKEEKERFLKISSLDFNEFYSNGEPRQYPERHILFKGNRVLENCYERFSKMDRDDPVIKEKLFKVMLKWGHISLLAQDWAKALSSYEFAYRLHHEEFWRDPGGYYGLGLVYIHFKEYKRAAEAFLRLLYAYPTLENVVEVKVRLGVCYQNLSEYSKALKYYAQALSDERDSPFMSRIHIRFNVAVTKENAGDLTNSEEEYKKILMEVSNLSLHSQYQQPSESHSKLMAAVNRHLGWICYRQPYSEGCTEERNQKLIDAVQFLNTATHYEQFNGKTFYLFGRCYGEMPNKAHDAFVNYRHSIDKSEADADTWCSIGWLYQQQQQPMDALQAFICAVELDAEHSAAWTDLGRLYELHHQFEDALSCFRKAVKYKPAAPEALKARILVLEKELQTSSHFLNQKTPQSHTQHPKPLPSLKEAWNQPIPSELRGRQDEFLKVKQQRYREGSALWKMGELSAPLAGLQECPGAPGLDSTQVQIMKLLQVNKERINEQETVLLNQMEQIFKAHMEASFDSFYSPHQVSNLPKFTENDVAQIKDGGHLNLPVQVKIENECDEDQDVKPETSDSVQDKSISSSSGLPTTFSLESKLNVSIDISSSELLELCSKRIDRPHDFKSVFDENVPPPQAPPAPSPSAIKMASAHPNPLLRPTPLIVVESRKDAQSVELQKYCENCPIALIRGMTSVLKMDLSLFSTKTLRESAPDHEVEVRTQYRMPCDINVDHLGVPTWECMSTRSFTSVNKYAQYQAETFQHSLKEEAEKLRSAGAKYAQQIAESSSAKKRRGPNGDEFAMPLKMIKFGTNVDLSDEAKWKAQLHELSKMPPFCRLIAGSNMLSHLGHTVLGMNTVQLYMKVPGSRTPAHQENNSFASVNINIGPGDCEWFGVPHEYWGVIERLCRKRGIDFLKGSFWPNVDDLLAENIPIYRFTQKAGDLVWVGGGCIHWVQATGWCNNIAWNVGPITFSQLSLSVTSYEWNKLQGYKSLVPMQHICWQLAKNVRFTNQKIFCLIKGQLIRSLAFCKMVADWAMNQGKQLKPQPRTKDEITHYCTLCEVEVFNILFVKEHNGKFPVYCVYCARRTDLNDFIVLQQIPFSELTRIFDEMQLNLIPKAQLVC